jgi:hypothetical protein
VARLIKEIIVLRWIGGTEKHGWLRVIIQCKREGTVLSKSLMWLWSYVYYFYIHVTQEAGGMCYTTKCDTVEDGLMERMHQRVT